MTVTPIVAAALKEQADLFRLIARNTGGDPVTPPASSPGAPAGRAAATPAAAPTPTPADHPLQDESAARSSAPPDATRSLLGLRAPVASTSLRLASLALDAFAASLAEADGAPAPSGPGPIRPAEGAAQPLPAGAQGAEVPGTAAPRGERAAPVGAVGQDGEADASARSGPDDPASAQGATRQPSGALFNAMTRGEPGSLAFGAASDSEAALARPDEASAQGAFQARAEQAVAGRSAAGAAPAFLATPVAGAVSAGTFGEFAETGVAANPRDTAQPDRASAALRATDPRSGVSGFATPVLDAGTTRMAADHRREADAGSSLALKAAAFHDGSPLADAASPALDRPALDRPALDRPAPDLAAAAPPSADARPSAYDAGVSDELGSLGFGSLDPAAATPLPERAGVIASFILNAHFIPGWPPPRPFAPAEAMATAGLASLAPDLSEAEMEKLLYLASLGLTPAQIERAARLMIAARRRSKLFDAFAVILTNLSAVLDTLGQEAKALAEELAQDPFLLKAEGRRRERIGLG